MEDFAQVNIKTCFVQRNIINQPTIIYKNIKNKNGDGYLGVVERAAVIGDGKVVNIVTKRAISNEAVRRDAIVREIYLNEITFYEVIVPSFVTLLESSNLDTSFITFTTCYGANKTESQEMLILQDLGDDGFTLWDRKTPMNPEHIEFVLKEYSKFHAISYAFKEQRLEDFNMVSKQLDQAFLKLMDVPMFATIDKFISDAKYVFNAETEREKYEFMKHFAENYRHDFSNILKSTDENSVVIHGDCWCNNMLFKYKDNKEIDSMRFIDFQFATIGSPIMDISYFLLTNSSSENLDRIEHYLMVYYNSLVFNLKRLNCTKKISPSDFRQQWKQYHRYGLILSIPVLKISLTDSEDAVNLNECNDVTTCFDYVSKSEKEVEKRLKKLLNFYYENQHLF